MFARLPGVDESINCCLCCRCFFVDAVFPVVVFVVFIVESGRGKEGCLPACPGVDESIDPSEGKELPDQLRGAGAENLVKVGRSVQGPFACRRSVQGSFACHSQSCVLGSLCRGEPVQTPSLLRCSGLGFKG